MLNQVKRNFNTPVKKKPKEKQEEKQRKKIPGIQ